MESLAFALFAWQQNLRTPVFIVAILCMLAGWTGMINTPGKLKAVNIVQFFACLFLCLSSLATGMLAARMGMLGDALLSALLAVMWGFGLLQSYRVLFG